MDAARLRARSSTIRRNEGQCNRVMRVGEKNLTTPSGARANSLVRFSGGAKENPPKNSSEHAAVNNSGATPSPRLKRVAPVGLRSRSLTFTFAERDRAAYDRRASRGRALSDRPGDRAGAAAAFSDARGFPASPRRSPFRAADRGLRARGRACYGPRCRARLRDFR